MSKELNGFRYVLKSEKEGQRPKWIPIKCVETV